MLTLVAGALLVGGCSTAPGLDTLATASVTPRAYAREPVPKGIAPDDWAAARTALAEALHEKEAAPSVPWENYASATRGTVTPLGEKSDGGKCREFLMSFVRDSREDWLQGEACRSGKNGWKVDQTRLLDRG
ncbi:RT0821/Lpp0805 family surface protein [Ancylobacter sp.]|uniref:RT0821/Lpp0805 family surface protein n=1 Tax=Ancylobacter sp. TaxID=1872567 RepID=UPI003D127BEC